MQAASAGRFFVKGQELTGRTPKQITAAGVGVVPEDRHAVGCVTGMSLAENLFLSRLESVQPLRAGSIASAARGGAAT